MNTNDRPMRILLLALLATLTCACQSTKAAEPSKAQVYVIAALMDAHPDPAPSETQVREASSGHFANIERLSDAGELLLAGPSGGDEGDFRGLFIFDVATVAEARELTASDPAIAGGLLRAELTTFTTEAKLDQLPRLVAEARARRMSANPNDPAEGFVGRPYIIATTNRGAAAKRTLARMIDTGRILFHGDLGPPAEGSALFLLDIETIPEAEVQLANSGAFRGLGASWALDLLWATEALVAVAELE